MKFNHTIYILFFIEVFSNGRYSQLIISMLIHNESLENVKSSINSILNQNIDRSLYKIMLMVTKKKKRFYSSNEFISFIKKNGIQLNIINKRYNFQNRLISTFKYWQNNPILIINENSIFPEDWLKMYIEDHMKYPNDIISGSVQYIIGPNLEIKSLSEGYNGKYFGTFNHITNLIFNFAFVNTQLGGTLFPPNAFKNKLFYNLELFSMISESSNDFWLSCFIMMENKILRQSSKIYDYTQYIINRNQIFNENQESLQKNLIRMIDYFPWFKKILIKRQKKVIISLTSYPQRFEFLPSVINSIKNQSFLIKNIKLVLFKNDIKLYKYNLDGIDIISVNEDLKPHKKYYYTMSKYRDYAIISLDDDTIYCRNTLKSLYNSYIEHPNIVSGRGGHYMKYGKNGVLLNYLSWFAKPNSLKNIDFNIFLIGVGGIIYPPDILNINEEYLDIIREFLIGDDFVLKHLEIKKGIEQRLIPNNHPQGLYMKNNSLHKPLYDINKYRNDLYIKQINTAIGEEIIKDLCIDYKSIQTGLQIYLFNINNIILNRTMTTFYIDAYSFCPIDNTIKFKIKFNKLIASCNFNENHSIVEKNFKIFETKKILVAFCFINRRIKNIDKYSFQQIISSNNTNLIIQNRIKYIPIIFQGFNFIDKNKYILRLIFFKNYPKFFNFNFVLNKIILNCTLEEEVNYENDIQPIIKNVNCYKINSYDINKNILISGLPKNNSELLKSHNNEISNIFIISKIYMEKRNYSNFIVIKGKIIHDLDYNLFDLKIYFNYPKKSLLCNIHSGTKNIQFYINCKIFKYYKEDIIVENQIIYSNDFDYNLLLINNETFLQNYRTFKNNNDYQINYIIKTDDELMNKIILIFYW